MESIDQVNAIWNEHCKKLDYISASIKILKEKLQNKKTNFTFIYVISSQKMKTEDRNVENYEEHAIVCGRNEKDAFTLTYNIYLAQDERNYYEENDYWIELPAKLISSTPLISTKAETRLRISDELYHFEEAFTEALKNTKYGKSITVSESPLQFFLSKIKDRKIS